MPFCFGTLTFRAVCPAFQGFSFDLRRKKYPTHNTLRYKIPRGGHAAIPIQLPAPDTQAHLLLTLIALSGELPITQVVRLPGSTSYKENVVKQLKRDKLIRAFYRDGLRGLRLTAAAKRLLLAEQPEQFQLYLTGNTDTNRLKSEAARRRRLHRMAEVLVTMFNAEVGVFQSEKPAVFSPIPAESGYVLEWPAYYGSRELKDIGQMAVKVRNSRSAGVLLAPDRPYAVYNVGPFLQTKWEYRAEMRLKVFLQSEICRRRIPQYHDAVPQGLVFGADMAQLPVLMEDGVSAPQNHFLLDGSYDHFYFFPSDYHGELLIQLLFDPGQRETLNSVLSENLCPKNPGWNIEHDAIDEDGCPVLFGYLCDMPRVRRFDTALNLQERSGTLICFDFQQNSLREICGDRVTFQTIDFGQAFRLLTQ